jgi:hypothetical protein
VEYDFSVLPSDRQKQYFILLLLNAGLLLGYILVLAANFQGLFAIFQVLLCVAIAGSLLYRYDHLDRRAFERFVTLYALQRCSEDEMWSLLPYCFKGLAENPDLLDATVEDGYILSLGDDRNCMVLNFSYILKRGNHSRTYTYAIALMEQKRVFPHMFLDGKQNGASYAYQKKQRLQLEGDFNDYFNLYVPNGEERDALEILTPDVMQVLVDGGRPYDIELLADFIVIIASGTQYEKERLPVFLKFMSLLETELNDGAADWDNLDMGKSSLIHEKYNDNSFILLMFIALITVFLVFSFGKLHV